MIAWNELGFREPERARRTLTALESALGAAAADEAIHACARSADPDRALSALDRIVAARAPCPPGLLTGRTLDAVAALGGATELFPRLLASRPELVDWLASAPQLESQKALATYRGDLEAELSRLEPSDNPGLLRALRRYKYRELVRIGARDLLGLAPLPEIARELSSLAEACLSAAIPFLDAQLRLRHGAPQQSAPGDGFCVLGMGKLGGDELNFSSDIDLIYLYGAEGRTPGGSEAGLTHFQYYARLAEQLTKAIGEVTEDGFVFRVDLNLRPDGRNGPIVNSADAMESYYESYGRTWERAALLRARPVAGDLAAGERVLAALAPFIWRRTVDYSTLDEMRALKAQLNRRAAARGDDLKLGPGGIREVEFFVQALQLLHGGKDARLRGRSTLGALSRSLFAGLITARDHDALADAYLLLRRAEHHVQMVAERQTYALPDDPAARLRIARSLGFATLEEFTAALARHRGAVKAIFDDVLQITGAAPAPADPALACALDARLPDDERLKALEERGFRAPAAALIHLDRLGRHRESPFASRGAPSSTAVRLLADCAASPDPDLALFHLADFFAAVRSPGPYYALLDANPATARLVTSLFGSSDFLSKYFLRHPELLDSLVRADQARPVKSRADLAAELAARLAPLADYDARHGAMRRYKNEEVLRVGVNDISGNLEVEQVLAQLTALAEVLLAESLALSWSEVVERYGAPRSAAGEPTTFAVLALGSFGAAELGYHSDLDLIFVYSESGETEGGSRGRCSNAELYARVAQRLLSGLSMQLREGFLYRTDVRLRPSGNQGTLVVSAQTFADHQRRAQVWERQALTRARCVAGDRSLFERLEREVLAPSVFRADAEPAELRAEVLRMRERQERELAQESKTQYNPKLGRGGLVDVQFAVQYLQLLHGAVHPEVRRPGTREALEALASLGLLDPPAAQLLTSAWRFLRKLENRLRIVHDHPMQHMPREGPSLETLARRMGYLGQAPGAQLLADYEALTVKVRGAFERIVAGP